MQRPILYLAGLISTDFPESLAWRVRVSPVLDAMGFDVRDPMRGKKDLKLNTSDGGMNAHFVSSKSIVLRDRLDVKSASLILAHLEDFGSPRPLLGTIAELGWSWDQRTPVIGIAREDNKLMRQHPFMVEFITHYSTTETEALAFIEQYYAPLMEPQG